MDELTWSDMLLGLILYAAIHAAVSELVSRVIAKVLDDPTEGITEEIEEIRKAMVSVAKALEALQNTQEHNVNQIVDAVNSQPEPAKPTRSRGKS